MDTMTDAESIDKPAEEQPAPWALPDDDPLEPELSTAGWSGPLPGPEGVEDDGSEQRFPTGLVVGGASLASVIAGLGVFSAFGLAGLAVTAAATVAAPAVAVGVSDYRRRLKTGRWRPTQAGGGRGLSDRAGRLRKATNGRGSSRGLSAGRKFDLGSGGGRSGPSAKPKPSAAGRTPKARGGVFGKGKPGGAARSAGFPSRVAGGMKGGRAGTGGRGSKSAPFGRGGWPRLGGGLRALAKTPGRAMRSAGRVVSAANARRAAVSMPTSARPRTARELLGAVRAASRARAKRQQDWYLTKWLPAMGRKVRRAVGAVAGLPRRTVRALFKRPALAVANATRRRWWLIRHWMLVRRRWLRIYGADALKRGAVNIFRRLWDEVRALIYKVPGWLWAPPASNPASVVGPTPIVPDVHDDEQDSDAPAVARPVRRHRPVPAAVFRSPVDEPPAIPTPKPVKRGSSVSDQAMHPAWDAVVEAFREYIGGYEMPEGGEGIPDTDNFLGTSGDAFRAMQEVMNGLADRFSGDEPIEEEVSDHWRDCAGGMGAMGEAGDDVYATWRLAQAADLERHENPRPNEQKTNV